MSPRLLARLARCSWRRQRARLSRPAIWTAARSLVLAVFLPCHVSAQTGDIGVPLGRLVDIDGRRLHLHCTGSGSPAVVIEAGASAFAVDFALVQPEIAKTTRVCSYDRAGSGWSDPRPDVETPIRVIRDLRTLLDTAGEEGPFVMVGASRGGVFVRLFQAEYQADVAGFVLIDPTAEDRLFVMFQGQGVALTSLTEEQHRLTQPPPAADIPVPTRQPQTGPPFDRLPPALYATRVALDRRLIASMPPTVPGRVAAEFAAGDYAMLSRLSAARKAAPALLGDMPLIVLTRGRGGAEEAHAELARMSRNSRHTVVQDSYHEIHLSHPAAVVRAVGDVVAAVRTKAPLSR
jgi:pimeloyl-ACP methyl ester carboxylesterase